MANENILVIDDEQEIRNLCKKLLNKESYNVDFAENGRQGLDKLQNNSFDVALVDLKMPGLNGLELLKHIKNNHIKTDTIVLTGYASIETAVEAMRLGSYDYISKPFNISKLSLVVSRCIEKRKLSKEVNHLRELDKLKSEFLTNVSHELKTPMNAIMGYTFLILDNIYGKLTKKQEKVLKKITANSKELLRMIENLLDLSKVNAGKMSLYKEKIKIKDIIQEIIITVEPLLKEKNLSIKKNIEKNLPLIISDKLRLKQILMNIINNAIKFTHQGKITISISKVLSEKVLKISIADEGIGIAKENLDVIFESFRQIDGSITRKYGGTGVGLNLTKKLTELLGGTIEVTSTLNKGSTFTLTLPYQEQELEKEAKGNLLIIDINQGVINRIRDFLGNAEYQVIGCQTKEEGIKLAKETNPFAIILDIMTAEQDSKTILKDLKNNPQTTSIPIIVLSSTETKSLALSSENKNYIIKPIKKENLLKKLEKLKKTKESKAMIIDDDPLVIDTLGNVLKNENYTVTTTLNGQEAFEKINKEKPDILFLDLLTPEIHGFDILNKIYSDPKLNTISVTILADKDALRQKKPFIDNQVQGIIPKEELINEKSIEKLEEILNGLKI